MLPAIRRLLVGAAFVALVIALGGVAIWLTGDGQWGLGESVYMSLISAATVGFGELPGTEEHPYARTVVALVILAGIAAFTFLQSALTAFFVEGALGERFRRRRMERTIEGLSGHVVVAGAGATGLHVIEELVATKTPFVVIDRNRAHLERVSLEATGGRMLFVVGEATADHTLTSAGVERASGVVTALTADRDNLYVTLSARSMNPGARIVSKVVEPEAAPKLLRAGANQTVSPNGIGGRRLAAELLRPVTTSFLDVMLRDRGGMRFTEATVGASSPWAGRTLRETPIREQAAGTLVVAVREPGQTDFRFNPPAAQVLTPGAVLVVLTDLEGAAKLRRLLEGT